jgi:hypothetical protein
MSGNMPYYIESTLGIYPTAEQEQVVNSHSHALIDYPQ